MKYKINKDNEEKLERKADLTFVKDIKAEIDKDIITMQTSIETFGDKNSIQHSKLFNGINEANEGIARIEGYLKAKNEKD